MQGRNRDTDVEKGLVDTAWEAKSGMHQESSIELYTLLCCAVLSHVSRVRLCDPMDCSLPGSSVHGILLARNWSGLPFPSPEDLPHPGIELTSLCLLHWQVGSLPIASCQFSSVAQSCPALRDPMKRNTPGLPVHHQLPESTQTHVH